MDIKITSKGRYKGHKGKFWDVFSDYVRVRDFINWGTCISCGKKFERYQDSQAGHYMAAGNCGFSLLFDETNVNAECFYCNGFDKNHQVGYRKNLNNRFGNGTAELLEARYEDSHFKGITHKEWNKREYEFYTQEYKQKIKDLSTVL